jgi:hypothetical protein
MKNITRAQLKNVILDCKGSSFFTLLQYTEAQKSKAKAAQKVFKLSPVNGLIGSSYTQQVKNQGKREGVEGAENFKAKPSPYVPYREEDENCPVLCLKRDPSQLYISYRPEKVVGGGVQYFTEGKEVTKAEVEHLLKPPSEKPSTQSHLSKAVQIRRVKFENIREIALNGESYRIID